MKDLRREFTGLAAFMVHCGPVFAWELLREMDEAGRFACLAVLAGDDTALKALAPRFAREGSPPECVNHAARAASILEHGQCPVEEVLRGMAAHYPHEACVLARHAYSLDMLWEQPIEIFHAVFKELGRHEAALLVYAEEPKVRQTVLQALPPALRDDLAQRIEEMPSSPMLRLDLELDLPSARQACLRRLRDLAGDELGKARASRVFNPRWHACPRPDREAELAHFWSDTRIALTLRELPAEPLAFVVYSLGPEARERVLGLCSPRTGALIQADMRHCRGLTFAMLDEAWLQWDAACDAAHPPA